MKHKILWPAIIVLLLSVLQSPLTHAEQPHNLKIESIPVGIKVNNLAPGDKVVRTLDVMNKGDIGFTYNANADFGGGSKIFYDALMIKIEDSNNKVLYNGSLKDFKGWEPRKISTNSKDHLSLQLEMPIKLSNDYQGLSTILNFTFTANKDIATAVDGKPLPETATNNYNFMLIGLLVISSGLGLYLYRKKRYQ